MPRFLMSIELDSSKTYAPGDIVKGVASIQATWPWRPSDINPCKLTIALKGVIDNYELGEIIPDTVYSSYKAEIVSSCGERHGELKLPFEFELPLIKKALRYEIEFTDSEYRGWRDHKIHTVSLVVPTEPHGIACLRRTEETVIHKNPLKMHEGLIYTQLRFQIPQTFTRNSLARKGDWQILLIISGFDSHEALTCEGISFGFSNSELKDIQDLGNAYNRTSENKYWSSKLDFLFQVKHDLPLMFKPGYFGQICDITHLVLDNLNDPIVQMRLLEHEFTHLSQLHIGVSLRFDWGRPRIIHLSMKSPGHVGLGKDHARDDELPPPYEETAPEAVAQTF